MMKVPSVGCFAVKILRFVKLSAKRKIDTETIRDQVSFPHRSISFLHRSMTIPEKTD